MYRRHSCRLSVKLERTGRRRRAEGGHRAGLWRRGWSSEILRERRDGGTAVRAKCFERGVNKCRRNILERGRLRAEGGEKRGRLLPRGVGGWRNEWRLAQAEGCGVGLRFSLPPFAVRHSSKMSINSVLFSAPSLLNVSRVVYCAFVLLI